MSSIIFWNCRGVRKKQTGHFLHSLVGGNEVVFVGLIETMIEDISKEEVDVLAGNAWDFLHFPANDRSGGILALWRRDISQFVPIHVKDQVMVVNLVLPSRQMWTVVIVYAGKNYHSRRNLWETLGSCIDADLLVIVGGDFNCCLDQNEKKGGCRFGFPMVAQEMAAFMSDNDLHDLGFTGPRFNWSNNKLRNSL